MLEMKNGINGRWMVGVRLLTDRAIGHRQARGGGLNNPCDSLLASDTPICDLMFSLMCIPMNNREKCLDMYIYIKGLVYAPVFPYSVSEKG